MKKYCLKAWKRAMLRAMTPLVRTRYMVCRRSTLSIANSSPCNRYPFSLPQANRLITKQEEMNDGTVMSKKYGLTYCKTIVLRTEYLWRNTMSRLCFI